MLVMTIFIIGFAFTLPYWLPAAIVSFRMRLFTRINGKEGLAVPGAFGVHQFREIYGQPAASGRSHGANLSDLFWYWLSPGPEMHQEHLEPGDRYDRVADTTRQILGISNSLATEMARHCISKILGKKPVKRSKLVRLRDLMMPIWADYYYELVFQEPCPDSVRKLIVDNANDVVSALKMTRLRHMRKRHRLTQFLVGKLERCEIPHQLPDILSIEEKAFYLQGVFFNTAIVQMSESLTHLLLFLSQHQRVQDRLFQNPEDVSYLNRVIAESLRTAPLFGIAHRITSDNITLGNQTQIPEGTVLCFNYPEFHHAGFENPKEFNPDRWNQLSEQKVNYMPFGSSGNRPCPAQGLALIGMRVVAQELVRRFSLFSSVEHSRSIPHRGPCLLVSRKAPIHWFWRWCVLLWMGIRNRWEDVGRSILQLFFGTYMIRHARRLSLCKKHFDVPKSGIGKQQRPGKCPFQWLFQPSSAEMGNSQLT